MYYKVETHDDEHVNDDEDEFIVPNTKVELIPADTSVSTTEPVHNGADDIPASVVVPENVEPGVCEVDPQQNDVQLTGGTRDGARYPRREHKVPSHLSDYDLLGEQINTVIDQMYANIDYCFKSSTVIIPKSYKQALASPDAERWKLSMDKIIIHFQ